MVFWYRTVNWLPLDKGQIDVQKTIGARNERIRTNNADDRDVNTSMVEVAVQNTNTVGKANGGFVGRRTVDKAPLPAAVVASTTAISSNQMVSSTESVASSTEPGAGEETATEPESTDETTTN